jgi:hypothetical protein
MRTYRIVFDGSQYTRCDGPVQVDFELRKVRLVRRNVEEAQVMASRLARREEANSKVFEEEDQCAICMIRFREHPHLLWSVLQPCGHRLHGACIGKLVDQDDRCPLCRRPIEWSKMGCFGSTSYGLAEASAAVSQPDSLDLRLLGAAELGDKERVRALLGDRADVDARSPGGATPLMFAACSGHVDAASVLLDRGASVHHETHKGNTAVLFAVRLAEAGASPRHLAVARLLIDKRADPHVQNKRGESAAQCLWSQELPYCSFPVVDDG